MIVLTSELVYALYLYDEMMVQNGSEEDRSLLIGYIRDLIKAVEHILDCPDCDREYSIDEETHNAILNLGRKYYD